VNWLSAPKRLGCIRICFALRGLQLAVRTLMARSTKGDQVFFRIVAKVTSPPQMMDIEIRHRSAALTAPPITL
jgi:hypothetical protein